MFFLKPPLFFAAPLKRRRNGFTLIELVVVIALVGIMLLVAIPNFQHLFGDNARKTSQWILLRVPSVRDRAVSENQIYALHVDMDNRKLWFSNGSMLDEDLTSAMESGLQLSDDIQILDVLYVDEGPINGGDAPIFFYPKGYSDKAILHLEKDDGARLSFLFEPFLKQVEMIDGYVDFEE